MVDSDIIDAILRDDKKLVVKELYRTVLPDVIKHVRLNSGSKSEAEDCFQDSLIELIATIRCGKFKTQYTIKNYMLGIARNKWYKELRRNKRYTGKEPAGNEMVIDESIRYIESEKEEMFRSLFDTLGEKCAQLLTMVIFDKMRHKEIMEKMNLDNVDIVKTSYHRCKKKLREKVQANPSLHNYLKGE